MAIAKYDVQKVIGTERINYFDNIGTNVQKASSLETAIALSGLNFEVTKQPLQFTTQTPHTWNNETILVDTPHPFPNQFATVRSDTLEPLGIVGKDYQILQNLEAFDFLDSLVGEAKFETAGLYGNGAKSFITMSTEPMKILDDEFAPYILFTNSFDGSGAVKVMFTPIRVFCSNCLVLAIKKADHKLSIRHSSNLQSRLDNARYVLLNNTNYLAALKAQSELLATTPFSKENFEKLARELFPVNSEDRELVQVRNLAQLEQLLAAYNQSDLQNFNNTAYKAVQAVADFESHKPVFKNTATIDLKNIKTVMTGMPMLNAITERLLASA